MRILEFDGRALKGSFDAFNDAKARQMLSPFASDTAPVMAHVEIDEKSEEIPAAQKLLEEIDVAGRRNPRAVKRKVSNFPRKRPTGRPPLPAIKVEVAVEILK